MGFFSWNCRGCGESMKAPYDLDAADAWQNDVVVITEYGVLSGDYDGYGRVSGISIPNYSPECWHKRCHIENGAPLTFTKSSDRAEDQGYFYERSN